MRFVVVTALVLILTLAAAASARATLEEEEYLMRTVQRLSAPGMQGRASGTLGGKLAAHFIASELRELGLFPLGATETGESASAYFQYFALQRPGEAGEAQPLVGRNILAWTPGTAAADPAAGCYILSAHYDHLGTASAQGGVRGFYPGANDNASGVAAVLAVARRCSLLGQHLPYPVVFAFFDGEEVGLCGAHAFAAQPPVPLTGAFNLNLDMVGRLEGRPLLAAFSAQMPGWEAGAFHRRLQEAAESLGLKFELMRHGWEASDQFVFYQHQVPFLFLFGGPTADYDRTTDTPDKLDYPGLAGVSAFVWQLLYALGDPSAYEWVDLGVHEHPRGAPRAFLGAVPDFTAEAEEGVVIAGTVSGSPAERAGLREGDIILELSGRPVHDLQALASILRELKPGDVVQIVFQRNGAELRASVRLEEKSEDAEETAG